MAFTVPGYRVDRLLGVGSQAEVWLGQHLATGERVALKRVAAGSAVAAAAGRAEAALLAALDHPNLIALRACLPLDTGLVLVLELAEAGTLAALLARRRRLTPPEVVAAISPIAAALAHAHDAGLLHGDVSAANILFSRAGRPKLADLGVARLLAAIAGSQAANRRPGAGQPPVGAAPADILEALGTPAYLDPTIAAGGAAGLASDVFSLGAVALHALTGAGPWQPPGEPAPSAEQALAVAATGSIAGLAERLGAVPPAMAEVLIRALDPAPHRRGTAAELALDLRAALPPARLELTGGRIAGPAVRRPTGHPASGGLGRSGQPDPVAFEMAPLESVPIDLTRIAPARPPTDIAAMLRAGAAAPPPGDAAPLPGDAVPPRRWARFRAAGSRRLSRLSAAWPGRLSRLSAAWPGRRSQLSAAGSRCRASAFRRRGRPARPVGRHRCAAPSASRFGRGRTVAGLLAAGLLVAGCVVGWPQLHRRLAAAESDAAATQQGPAPPSAGSRTVTEPPDRAPADPAQAAGQARPDIGQARPGPARLAGGAPVTDAEADGIDIRTAADAARVLAGLAAVRERAYAQRRPDLLAGVYASAALLAADSQQLYRSVPAGCGLSGVRTGYRGLRLDSAADTRPMADNRSAADTRSVADNRSMAGTRSVAVTATVSLPSAVLSCRLAVRGQTRPTGPIWLRLVLADEGRGWRIVSERPG
jgi:Protein kinase domain